MYAEETPFPCVQRVWVTVESGLEPGAEKSISTCEVSFSDWEAVFPPSEVGLIVAL